MPPFISRTDWRLHFRNLPRAILIGVPLVIVLYLCVNVSYFTVMSVDDILESPAVAIVSIRYHPVQASEQATT